MTKVLDIKDERDEYASVEAFREDYAEVSNGEFDHAVHVGREEVEGGRVAHTFVAGPAIDWAEWSRDNEGQGVEVFEVTIEAAPDADLESLARVASGAVQDRVFGLENGGWSPEYVEEVRAALDWREREARAAWAGRDPWPDLLHLSFPPEGARLEGGRGREDAGIEI
jgi:hypothetical protein